MDSSAQNSVNGVLKIIKYLAIFTLIIVTAKGWSNIKISNNYITLIKSVESAPTFSEILTGSEYNNFNNEIDNEKQESLLDNDSISTFKEKILNTFNIKIEGYAITISDNTFGYVATEEERNIILNKICHKYVEEMGIDPKNIVQIGLVGKLEAIPNKINLSEIGESSEIADEIYEASVINKDLLGLQIKINTFEEDEIEPSTIIEHTEELYVGNSEVTQGKQGSRLVYKESIYNGLTKEKENIITEKVIVEAEPTIIKKGTKNPYYDGVAFLSSPTRGGYMTAPYGEERTTSPHKGIDIAKNLGDDVNAALDGKVVSAGYNNGGYGNLIIIEHEDNMQTYYAHLSEINVSVGDYVKKGDKIGAIGSTGYSTGPHLHFELRVNGNPVNPTNYIKE